MTAPAAQEAPLQAPPRPASPSRLHHLLLALILVFAAGLRVAHLHDDAFWLDEIYSLEITRGQGYTPHTALPLNTLLHNAPDITRLDSTASPWWRIWSMQTTDTHPPLYFILLRFWRDAFGQSDTAARVLSVIASTASVALLYFLARQIIGPPAALWAALLCAVAPVQIGYAVEARSYALDTTLCLATALLLLRIERLGWSWPRAIALGLGLLIMELSHYFTAGPALAMALYALFRFRGRKRLLTLATFAAAAALWLALWGPMFLKQVAYVQRNLLCLTEPAAGHTLVVLGRVATMPLQLLGLPAPTPLAYAAAIFYLLPLLLLRRFPQFLFPLLYLAAGVGIVAALDWQRCTNHLTFIRYPLIAAPGVYMLVPALLAPLRRPWLTHALPAVIALACLSNTPGAGYKWQENWREITDYMTAKGAQSGDAVVLIANNPVDWEMRPSTLYLGIRHFQQQRSLDYALVFGTRVEPQLAARLLHYPRVWVVAGWLPVGPGDLIPGMEPFDALRLERIGSIYRFRPATSRSATTAPARSRP